MSACLVKMQHQHNLPVNLLILDTLMHWNSMFYMLQQLYLHQWAINKYLCEHGMRTSSGEQDFFQHVSGF